MKTTVTIIILAITSAVFAWEPTPDFIQYMKSVEGFRAKPYRCTGGHLTIGYGHRMTHEDAQGMVLTEGGATSVLIQDLKDAYQRTGGSLEGARAEMAVDFVFNGCPPYKFPKFFAALRSGDYDRMRLEYKRYSNGRELTGRNRAFYARYLQYGTRLSPTKTETLRNREP